MPERDIQRVRPKPMVLPANGRTLVEETLERVRRIETRLATVAIGLGIETPTQKPAFDIGALGSAFAVLTLPSLDCSMKQIKAAIPHDYRGPVRIMLGRQRIGQLDLTDRTW